MRLILLFLLLSLGADAQIIRANAFYVPQPSGVTYLLDAYPNAAAAYSLRKLKSSYSGSAIRIRRDSTGNAETDIGFTANGDLDTAAIKNHCRNNSCMVTTWYDQSGNARNATQSTAANQPRIITSGVIDKIGGKIGIKPDGSNDFLNIATGLNILQNKGYGYIFSVACNTNTSISYLFFLSNNISGTARFLFDFNRSASKTGLGGRRLDADAFQSIQASTNYSTTALQLHEGRIDYATSDAYIYLNSTQVASNTSFQTNGNTSNTASASFSIFGYSSSNYMQGYCSEIIFFNTDQSSNRTGIETNINNYYGLW